MIESGRCIALGIVPAFNSSCSRTSKISICPKHGYLKGEQKFCPICDEEIIARKKSQSNQVKEVVTDE